MSTSSLALQRDVAFEDMRMCNPAQARAAIRSGSWARPTAGLAKGFAQTNLAIVPSEYAADFLRFCMANRQACPILDVTAPGDPCPASIGGNIDLRSDLPRYKIFENGLVVDEPSDITHYWRDDLVSFSIGCSFSFEEPLMADGVRMKHIEQGTGVPVYRTNIPLIPAGPFGGNLVVSMRPLTPTDAIRAVQITTDMPSVHGAPVHIAKPELIGIDNLMEPDFGFPPIIDEDTELPVFWACGVTPQIALMNAALPFAISHAPGYMLITDVPNHTLKYR